MWLGKFTNHFKYETSQVEIKNKKSIINFIKNFIGEVAKNIIKNKSLKIPDPKTSAKFLNRIIKNQISNKINNSNSIVKNIEQKENIEQKTPKTENINTTIVNEKKEKNNQTIKNKEIQNHQQKKYIYHESPKILHKALNAYKTFSQLNIFNEPNFIFFQLFGMPVFLNVSDEIDIQSSNKKKIKRIAFSFISNNFGLINSIIYKKDNSISLNFFIEKNNDIFKNNINDLIQDIQNNGLKIEGLQINALNDDLEINKKGLYG
ncbi:hypothetical protein JCM30566_16930 [Marinitoga arctica]